MKGFFKKLELFLWGRQGRPRRPVDPRNRLPGAPGYPPDTLGPWAAGVDMSGRHDPAAGPRHSMHVECRSLTVGPPRAAQGPKNPKNHKNHRKSKFRKLSKFVSMMTLDILPGPAATLAVSDKCIGASGPLLRLRWPRHSGDWGWDV